MVDRIIDEPPGLRAALETRQSRLDALIADEKAKPHRYPDVFCGSWRTRVEYIASGRPDLPEY
jgi:hypothetical protein